ncbi:MAG TPA: hypothetical protein VFB32_08260, partial [Rudaea sp.]|nr:hypothetical protein [Rudaea sp.]
LQVGGTDLTTASAGGAWAAETAWSDSGGGFYGAAGYSIPTYQQTSGVITATNAGSTTLRNDPDVSAEANFDNPTASNGRFLSGYGGTSFAAPRWAGFIALANEQAAVNGRGPLGFVNTALYAAAEANQAANFHDVASGSNGGFSAVAGYDLVTGWGSPNGATLINTLAGPASTPGFVVSAYPTNPGANPGASTTSTISIGALNGYTGNVTLSASGLPTGVTASFSPPSPAAGSSSTLTLSADNTVAAGTAAHVTITGTATGAATQTAAVNLLVGAPPAASLAPASLVFNDVPTGTANELLSIANGAQSLPLTYTIAAFASSGGACRGVVTWLAASVDSGSVTAGQPTKINVSVNPNGTLALGTYTAELCLVTNDGANPRPVVPVTLNIVQGPIKDTIFASSFEPGENGGANVVTYSLDQPIEDDQAGSALDLAEGFWHTWDNSIIDNINLFDDGTGLKVYWYDDKLPTQFANKVGGVVSGGNYAVLHAGAIVGPSSAFSRSVSTMTNWVAGTDGYLGIAFLNSQTNALNYGYLHLRTTGPAGFPAQVLDYGFDASGAAIEIP